MQHDEEPSRSYAAKRKEIAAGMDLGANLEKARAAMKLVVRKGNKRENVK